MIVKKRHNKRFLQILMLLLLGFAGQSLAQSISIRAYVSKNRVGLNEQFTYSVEVSGKTTSLPDPEFPPFNDFYVLSGPNPSTNIQFVNGRLSSSKTNTFYLQPKKEGQLPIGKAKLTYKGHTYTSNAITITVTKGSSAAPSASNRQPRSPVVRNDQELSGQSLYLKTQISRRNVYLGQQVTVTYKLYFRVNVRSYNMDKAPTFAGFWNEDFKLPAQPTIENEVVNGVNYNVAVLRKVALFPTQSGDLTIAPMQITLEAVVPNRRRSRSLFDSFFDDPFGNVVKKTVIGKALKIHVKPLPEAGKPADFSGAVGKFRFRVTVDKKQAPVNEAISLKLLVSGSGNIKMAALPKITLPQDIEQYEPKISSKIKHQGNVISGSKTAEYILIPRIEGDYQIKPLRFSYFDPVQKQYKTITSRPISLHILKGGKKQLTVNQPAVNFSGQEVALLGQDIRFIKEFSDFEKIGYKPYLSFSYWLSILLGVLLFLAFILYNNRQAVLLGNERLARSRKAGKIAAKQLSRARSLLAAPQETEFYKAISQALQGFVRDRLNIELSEFSTRSVREKLTGRGIAPQEVDEYIAVLEESDFRQYASGFAGREDRRNFYEKAKTILTKLEKWI